MLRNSLITACIESLNVLHCTLENNANFCLNYIIPQVGGNAAEFPQYCVESSIFLMFKLYCGKYCRILSKLPTFLVICTSFD